MILIWAINFIIKSVTRSFITWTENVFIFHHNIQHDEASGYTFHYQKYIFGEKNLRQINLLLKKFFLLLEQNKRAAKILKLILKINRYEINNFCIKNSKNFCIQYWFCRETCLLLSLLKFLLK